MPRIESSYVFADASDLGADPDADRGQLVVGVVLRWAEPRVIVDALPPGVFEEFLEQDARAAGEPGEIEPEEFEPVEFPEFSAISRLYKSEGMTGAMVMGLVFAVVVA